MANFKYVFVHILITILSLEYCILNQKKKKRTKKPSISKQTSEWKQCCSARLTNITINFKTIVLLFVLSFFFVFFYQTNKKEKQQQQLNRLLLCAACLFACTAPFTTSHTMQHTYTQLWIGKKLLNMLRVIFFLAIPSAMWMCKISWQNWDRECVQPSKRKTYIQTTSSDEQMNATKLPNH